MYQHQHQHQPTATGSSIGTAILPSFPRIRQQNLDVLYGEDHYQNSNDDRTTTGTAGSSAGNRVMDKSRMGHVDKHIQALVDCINQNTTNFVTLSSCSGRIALFHPTATTKQPPVDQTTSLNQDTVASSNHAGNRNTPDASSTVHPIDENTNATSNTATTSGKGSTGSWVFVSHDVVTDPLSSIVPFFFTDIGTAGTCREQSNEIDMEECPNDHPTLLESQVCYFKFEPMLLHVAACNIEAGQSLLKLALHNGLRESGMIVTSQRVTVALRTHSLALSVPLSFHRDHIFFPKSIEYILSLTKEFNRRLVLNLQLIRKLLTSVQEAFLPLPSPSVQLNSSTIIASDDRFSPFVKELSVSLEQQQSQVPALDLYGHTTIKLVTMVDGEVAPLHQILVFGGYGSGPSTVELKSQRSKIRSSNVYRLRGDEQLMSGTNHIRWNSYWENVNINFIDKDYSNTDTVRIQIPCNPNESEIHKHGGDIKVKQVVWDGRLYTTAINLTQILIDCNNRTEFTVLNPTHILIFGGRYGPNKPLNDLALFEYTSHGATTTGRMLTPLDVRGTLPTPRWGHTLTTLNRTRRNIQHSFDSTVPVALLTGGRNTSGNTTDPIYMLSIVPVISNENKSSSDDVAYHFLWEQLSVGNDNIYRHLSRCFHTATTIGDMDHIFIFGGLFHPERLVEGFGAMSMYDDDKSAKSLLITLTPNSLNNVSDDNESYRVHVDEIQTPHISHRLSHSAVCLSSSYEQHLIGMDQLSKHECGMILLAGGVSMDNETNASNIAFMDCLQYAVNNGKIVFNDKNVDFSFCNMDSNNNSVLDPGLMINHSCIAFPRIATCDESCRQHEVLFVGGGVSGFAFQELFALSLRFVVKCNFDNHSKRGNDNTEARQTSIIDATNRTTVAGTKPLSTSIGACDRQRQCDVVYVIKQNAKKIKICLESLHYIDKNFRMTEVNKEGIIVWLQSGQHPHLVSDVEIEDHIAIPIVSQFMDALNNATDADSRNASSLIIGYGKQICLPSTGAYARGIGARV